MGLLQKAVETYDCHKSLIGQYREGHAVLAPVAHVVTRAALEITLDSEGSFVSARKVDKEEPKILIPASESSAGRAGTTICAHPLCDQLGYLTPCNEKKFEDYVKKLTAWSRSDCAHPMLAPILSYVTGCTMLSDLAGCGLITLTSDGKPEDEKLLVRWRVLDVGPEENCWMDPSLFDAYIRYDRTLVQKGRQDVCMVTGEDTRIALQHPKGIVAFNGNAKLISANDNANFTFRGRFTEDWQAATIGYAASQKAHSALRWLVSEQGAVFGGRTFLCWNPAGVELPQPTRSFRKSAKPSWKPSDYRDDLQKTLSGYRSTLPQTAGVVIAAFDAATSGRLSLTYYNELMGSDFLDRLYEWDLHCCWPTRNFGIQSPGLFQIVSCAFGTQQTEKGKTKMVCDDRILRQQMQRLLSCRIDCAPKEKHGPVDTEKNSPRVMIPSDIVLALTQNASAPLAHDDEFVRETILTTACAVIRKYHYDRFEEDWDMSLEPDKLDISYQYGRLLAVFEKVERDTYDSDTGREPNAIRQQTVFCQRPMYAAANIEKQLERAYFPRLKPGIRSYYKKLIGGIMAQIARHPETEWNKQLKETYLMGYYLQREALYAKKETDHNEMEEQENG